MENIEIDRFIYLLILGLGIGGWFIAENRQSLGKSVRQGMAWFLIFIGIVAVYGLWNDIKSDIVPQQSVFEDGRTIELPRNADGHFRMTIELNDVPINVLVDTGASDFVLSLEDAQRIGIDVDNIVFAGSARTANGVVSTAYTTADSARIGTIDFGRTPISINGAQMDMSLLGMSFLEQFDKIEISGDRMVLSR